MKKMAESEHINIRKTCKFPYNKMDTDTHSCKIKETVLHILQHSDFNESTEFIVRAEAARQLGLDLSGVQSRALVRSVVNSFLRSKLTESGNVTESSSASVEEQNQDALNATAHAVVLKDEEKLENKNEEKNDGVDLEGYVCKLSGKRFVTVQTYRGKTLVSIREYYCKDGKQLPSRKGRPTGITLTADQWSIMKNAIPAIEEAVEKIKSKLG